MDGNYLTIPVRLNCADCNQVFYFYTRTAYELHISAHDWCRAKQTIKRQPPVALPGSAQSELRQLTPPATGRFASSLPQPVAGQVTDQSRPINDGDLPVTELRLGPPAVPAGRFMNRVPQVVTAGPVIRSSWPMKNEGGGRRYHPYRNILMSKEEEAYRQRCTRDFLHDWPILLGNSSNRRDRNGNKTFENRRTGEENVDLSVFRSTRASDDQEDSTVDLELKLGL